MNTRRIVCPPALDEESGRELLEQVRRERVSEGESVVLDLANTTSMDSRGGAWIVAISSFVSSRRGEVRCEGHTGSVAEFVGLIEPGLAAQPKRTRIEEGVFEEVGSNLYKYAKELREFFVLLVDTIYWMIFAPIEGRGLRWELWLEEMYEMGVRAVRINCLMNFLLGLIIAMLSAAQVVQFGLGIYVASLVVIAFARELGAIMTATVVSARTGAAITAELATMKVQEEIDALRGMGLNVVQFLVVPKVLALIVVMPCLTVLGMIAGILGGAVWGILVLGFAPDQWFQQTLLYAKLSDFTQGMLKTVCFAVTIVLIGCHNGLRVSGGSRGVGLMTTRAVVMDIFFVIVIDMIFAAVFYYVLPKPEW